MKKLFIFIFLLIEAVACSPQYVGHIATISKTADITVFAPDTIIKYDSAVVEKAQKTYVKNNDSWSNVGTYESTEKTDLGFLPNGFIKIETSNGEQVMFRSDNVILENIKTETAYGDLDSDAINAAETYRAEKTRQSISKAVGSLSHEAGKTARSINSYNRYR